MNKNVLFMWVDFNINGEHSISYSFTDSPEKEDLLSFQDLLKAQDAISESIEKIKIIEQTLSKRQKP